MQEFGSVNELTPLPNSQVKFLVYSHRIDKILPSQTLSHSEPLLVYLSDLS